MLLMHAREQAHGSDQLGRLEPLVVVLGGQQRGSDLLPVHIQPAVVRNQAPGQMHQVGIAGCQQAGKDMLLFLCMMLRRFLREPGVQRSSLLAHFRREPRVGNVRSQLVETLQHGAQGVVCLLQASGQLQRE